MKPLIISGHEKGQSLVELALVLLLVVTILAGVVDLGRMMFEYQAMRDAAQEGAGYGAIYPNYCAEIENRVLQNLQPSGYDVTVSINGNPCSSAPQTSACEGNEILVNIVHYSEVTIPLLSPILDPEGDGVRMEVEVSDRIVRPSCSP